MHRIVCLAVLATLAACAAGPVSESRGAAAERVCRKMTPTGSSLPERDCRTADEWAAADARAKAGVEDTMRTTNTPGAN